jgi:hypothetical protein
MWALVWGRIREVSAREWQRVSCGGLRMCCKQKGQHCLFSKQKQIQKNSADRTSRFWNWHRWQCRRRPFKLLRRVVRRKADVSEDHIASIFRDEEWAKQQINIKRLQAGPEYGYDMFLRNVGLSPNRMALQLRIPYSRYVVYLRLVSWLYSIALHDKTISEQWIWDVPQFDVL